MGKSLRRERYLARRKESRKREDAKVRETDVGLWIPCYGKGYSKGQGWSQCSCGSTLSFESVYRKKIVPNGSWNARLECPWGIVKLFAAKKFKIQHLPFNIRPTRNS
jgi:hypothetical protein